MVRDLSFQMSTWVMLGLTIQSDFNEPVQVICDAMSTTQPHFTFSSYTLVKIGLQSTDLTGSPQ